MRYVSGHNNSASMREAGRNQLASPLRGLSPAFPSLPLSSSITSPPDNKYPSNKEASVLVSSPLRSLMAPRVTDGSLLPKPENKPPHVSTSSSSSIRSDNQPRLILNLEFSLSPEVSVNVPVFEGELPETVARKFMHDYGLTNNQQVEKLLVSLIASRMAEL
jgi:hypothetical protein